MIGLARTHHVGISKKFKSGLNNCLLFFIPRIALDKKLALRFTKLKHIARVTTLLFSFQVVKPSLEFCAEQIEYEIEDGHLRAIFGNVAELLQIHGALKADLENEVKEHTADSTLYNEEEKTMKLSKSCVGETFFNAVCSLFMHGSIALLCRSCFLFCKLFFTL